jgi:hypothetical protein
VSALLERMRAEGLTLVVATSAKEEMDAPRHSPAPVRLARGAHARRHALRHRGGTPRRGRTVALRSGGWDDSALAGAVAVYADASDVLDRFESSPFARSPPG